MSSQRTCPPASASATTVCHKNYREFLECLRGGSSYYSSNNYDDPQQQQPSAATYRGRSDADRYGRASMRGDDSEVPWEESDRYYYGSSPDQEQEEFGYAEKYDDNGDYYYGDRPRRRQRRDASTTSSTSSNVVSMMPSILKTGDKRIGLILLGAGSVVTMLGMSLFFNKTLMRLGNLLFIAGVPMTLGPSKVVGYFWQPQKARATICLAIGIFLVFVGWPVFGMALEVFGLLNLFGNMFPVLLAIAKQMPVVGNILNSGSDSRSSTGNNSKRRRERHYDSDDYYYEGNRDRPREDDDERYY